MTTYTLSTMCFIKKLLNIQNSLKFSAIDILREINFDKFWIFKNANLVVFW